MDSGIAASRRPGMTRKLFPGKLRLALLLESRDALLQILAATDRVEDAARFGDNLERPLRHRLARKPLQSLHYQRRIAGDPCRHLLRLGNVLALRRDPVDEPDLVGALN